jgi:hypothetical protein
MKLFIPVILISFFLLSGCNTAGKKQKTNPNELDYVTTPESSNDLSADLNLSADPVKQMVNAQLKLTNGGAQSLNIGEIAIATAEGIRTLPLSAFAPFSLAAGKDTSLSLKFNPINDLNIYRVTGMPGILKSDYSLSVTYMKAANANLAPLVLKAHLNKDDFTSYKKKYVKPTVGYSFDTKGEFNELEKKYLEKLKDVGQTSFVYLSDQEIAVSGLNFQLKSYYTQDTLHAELFIVNHSGFEAKLNIDSLNITAGGTPLSGETKTAAIEKITGSQQYPAMIEKDDRELIHFKKYLKIKKPGADTLTFKLRSVFMLKGGKRLFALDARLLPKQF